MFDFTIIKTEELKRLKVSERELSDRWIGQLKKEDLISRLIGLPSDLVNQIYGDLAVRIEKTISEDMATVGLRAPKGEKVK